jgi:hypothetical protein
MIPSSIHVQTAATVVMEWCVARHGQTADDGKDEHRGGTLRCECHNGCRTFEHSPFGLNAFHLRLLRNIVTSQCSPVIRLSLRSSSQNIDRQSFPAFQKKKSIIMTIETDVPKELCGNLIRKFPCSVFHPYSLRPVGPQDKVTRTGMLVSFD